MENSATLSHRISFKQKKWTNHSVYIFHLSSQKGTRTKDTQKTDNIEKWTRQCCRHGDDEKSSIQKTKDNNNWKKNNTAKKSKTKRNETRKKINIERNKEDSVCEYFFYICEYKKRVMYLRVCILNIWDKCSRGEKKITSCSESESISKRTEKVSFFSKSKKNYVLFTKVQTMSEHWIMIIITATATTESKRKWDAQRVERSLSLSRSTHIVFLWSISPSLRLSSPSYYY